jgi:hypothetical protein
MPPRRRAPSNASTVDPIITARLTTAFAVAAAAGGNDRD